MITMDSKGIILLVRDDKAYRYRPGTTFISVWPDSAERSVVPFDMIEMPEWINRTKVNRDALEAVVFWYEHGTA
jgi:hypothetical protein